MRAPGHRSEHDSTPRSSTGPVEHTSRGLLKNPLLITLCAALCLAMFYNLSFWRQVAVLYPLKAANLPILLSVFVFIAALNNMVLVLLGPGRLMKPVLSLVIVLSALAAYFMDSYGVMIDREMVMNVLETDGHEVMGLLTLRMFLYLLALGVIPSYALWRLRVRRPALPREVLYRLAAVGLSLAVALGAALPFYKHYVNLRKNTQVRHYANAANYIYAFSSYLRESLASEDGPIMQAGLDARVAKQAGRDSRRNLVVLVVGETARAHNFSLNGYGRETNPLLSHEDIFNFPEFYSCTTSTATAIPCMFSSLGSRGEISEEKRTENLLDVLTHSGVKVLWRENNSGCKGACDRVQTEYLTYLPDPALCPDGQCYDEILLKDLQGIVDSTRGDLLIVMHQIGSHGPAYYKRVPREFEAFGPRCETQDVQDCSHEELENAYDDTILYLDYFLDRLIGLLRENSADRDTALFYISDHGESLGENNIYLHGLPVFVAPDEQRHIPAIIWLSRTMEDSLSVNRNCLRQRTAERYSQDNMFHTVLGLMSVRTSLYRPEMDMLSPCEPMHSAASSVRPAAALRPRG